MIEMWIFLFIDRKKMQVNLLIRYELKQTITVIKTHFKPIVLYIVPMNYQMCATWERINKCW